MKNSVKYIGIIIAALLFTSCSLTKWVPKGDALYTGATVKVEDSLISSNEKKEILDLTKSLPVPKPNSKFLGIPFKLILYNMGGDPDKGGFIRKFFRKLGQPPVLLSSVSLDYNVKLLTNFQQNIGYFDAEATGDTIVKKKKGHAYYTLHPGIAYRINEVKFEFDSSAVGKSITDLETSTLLRPGHRFNLEMVKGERLRIDAVLKENGYYYFSPDLLIVEIDSTVGDHKLNMYVTMKDQVKTQLLKPYIIDDIYIYPNYKINSKNNDTSHLNRNLYKGYYIIDPQKKFKPSLFPDILRFDSGDVYNRSDHNKTLSRLINLDVFKFVKNRFEESPNTEGDTGRLNTYYYLTPLPKKSLRAEIAGNTKSNDYIGTVLTVTFRNRNTFKRAEHLDIYANVGSEVQYGGYKSGYNTFKLGGGVKFTFPRFIVPFFYFNTTNAYVPRTIINLSFELLNRRKLYTLNSYKAELGYSWKPNQYVQHELNPISLNYIQAVNITQKYLDSIRVDPILKHAIDTQFIISSNYTFTRNPLVNDPFGTGFYINALADVSGNAVGLFVPPDADGKKRINGSAFAQYLKGQLDLRYYYAFNKSSRLANRLIVGVGYPYGNSRQLPFIKQFFIGGTNSIRAFRARSIGPGSYFDPKSDTRAFFPDQSGDIKIELNTEFRYQFTKIIEGAAFIDAGNIWLYNDDPNRPGAKFSKDFLKEFAVGTGIGLRLNLTILLLRLDVAIPLRKPWLPPGERWVFDQINFGSKDWRSKNLIFNLAIGYPF